MSTRPPEDVADLVDTTERQEENLGEFLASRARRTTDSRLAGQAVGAILAAMAIGMWRGPAWEIRLAIAGCLLGFGLWGIADRELDRRSESSRLVSSALRATRVVAAIVGFASAAFLVMALLGRALGTIIS